MVLKVYISGMSGNKEVKKRQQRVLMILESKNIQYEAIDITEPGRETDKEFMQNKSTSNGATVSDPEPRHALPPQIFNEEEYCGDYDAFDLANEIDTLEQFLKVAPPVVETPAAVLSAENGEEKANNEDGSENKENEGGDITATEEKTVKDGEASEAVENAENPDRTDKEKQEVDDNKKDDASNNAEEIDKDGDGGAASDKTKFADDQTKDEKDEAENSEIKEGRALDHSKGKMENATESNDTVELGNDSEKKKEEDSQIDGDECNDSQAITKDSKETEDVEKNDDENDDNGENNEREEVEVKQHNMDSAKKIGEETNYKNNEDSVTDVEADDDIVLEKDEKESKDDEILKYNDNKMNEGRMETGEDVEDDANDNGIETKQGNTKTYEDVGENEVNSGEEDTNGTISEDESEREIKYPKNNMYEEPKNETEILAKEENPEIEASAEKYETIKDKIIDIKDEVGAGGEKRETYDGEKENERVNDDEHIAKRENYLKKVDEESKKEIKDDSEIEKAKEQTNSDGESKKETIKDVATSDIEIVKTTGKAGNKSSSDEESSEEDQ